MSRRPDDFEAPEMPDDQAAPFPDMAEAPAAEEKKEEKKPCLRCKAQLTAGQYKRVKGGVICRDQPSCRQRVLSEELGIDLFTRYPRERTFFEMNPMPEEEKEARRKAAKAAKFQPPSKKKAKPGWAPRFTEDERVMAAWIYYSWCYPVGLAYAVQIDAADEIMHDRWGQPMPMTQERLAGILGTFAPNVSRATSRLAARKLLRVEDGRVYPVAKPQISAEEDQQLSTDLESELGEDPNTIPVKYRHLLNDVLADAPEDIRNDSLNRVLKFCSDYNTAHRLLRSERDSGIEQVVTEVASLLSRHIPLRRASKQRDATVHDGSLPASSRSLERNRKNPDKEEYAPQYPDRHQSMRAPAGASAIAVLYEGIPVLQAEHRDTTFGRDPFNAMGKPHKALARRILDALEGHNWEKGAQRQITAPHVAEFLEWVRQRFLAKEAGGGGRSPGRTGLVVLVDWAGDWAAGAPQRAAQAAELLAEAEKVRQHRLSVAQEQEDQEILDAAVEDAWEQMPATEKQSRLEAARDELKDSGIFRDRWKMLTEEQRSEQTETNAKRTLRREIAEADEAARGAGA